GPPRPVQSLCGPASPPRPGRARGAARDLGARRLCLSPGLWSERCGEIDDDPPYRAAVEHVRGWHGPASLAPAGGPTTRWRAVSSPRLLPDGPETLTPDPVCAAHDGRSQHGAGMGEKRWEAPGLALSR